MYVLVDRAHARKPCSPFMSYAVSAVLAEQVGDFHNAATAWTAKLKIP